MESTNFGMYQALYTFISDLQVYTQIVAQLRILLGTTDAGGVVTIFREKWTPTRLGY